ncbi:uncharacterized protein LOC117329342 [Pecten maximus]|uniref:uncharacterized protein LOC117329342 n=1 Tax=Pecten maximus TaxID=6579 RepID=UPI0014580FAB|nr:uncharacterized protein LOC117329342 [Pecten maximus]
MYCIVLHFEIMPKAKSKGGTAAQAKRQKLSTRSSRGTDQMPASNDDTIMPTIQPGPNIIPTLDASAGNRERTPVGTGTQFSMHPQPMIGTQFNIQPQPITGVCDNLGLHVSNANKQKILNGEYIDLSILLPKNVNQPEASHKVAIVEGELVIQPKTVKIKINDINSWTDAFIIYMSIYIDAHPEQMQSMLKYMQSVRLGASRSSNMGWKQYDEQYRLRKSRLPLASWGLIDPELWFIYMQSSSPAVSLMNNATTSSQSTLKCYDYNYKGQCSRHQCQYKHKCLRCNGNHSSSKCFQRNNNQYRFRAQQSSHQPNTAPTGGKRPGNTAKPVGSGKVPN